MDTRSSHSPFCFGNVYPVYAHSWSVGPIAPLWSLSIEEQFYIAVPIAFKVAGKRSLKVIFLITLVVAYTALAWLGHKGVSAGLTVWANSFVQFQFFAVGGLCALLLYQSEIALSIPLRVITAVAGLGAWIIAATRYDLMGSGSTTRNLLLGYSILLIGTTMIFIAVLDMKVRVPRPLVYLGKISYGLYLFHQLFIEIVLHTYSAHLDLRDHPFVAAIVALSMTIATAALSYHYFERPILKYKQHFETVRTRPA